MSAGDAFLLVIVGGVAFGKLLDRRGGVLMVIGIVLVSCVVIALCTGGHPSGPLVNR